jgi:hypothetical protein
MAKDTVEDSETAAVWVLEGPPAPEEDHSPPKELEWNPDCDLARKKISTGPRVGKKKRPEPTKAENFKKYKKRKNSKNP